MSVDSHHRSPVAGLATTLWRGLMTSFVVAAAASGVSAGTAPLGSSPGSSASTESPVFVTAHPGDGLHQPQDVPALPKDWESVTTVDQIFRSDVPSVKAVPGFSRGVKAWGAVDGGRFTALLNATSQSPRASGAAAALTSADLTETIFALRSVSAKPATSGEADAAFTAGALVDGRAPRRAPQMFWEDADGADLNFSTDTASVDVTSTRAGSANVLIPLPAAAWSALSVMAGAGALAAARRFRRQFC